MFGDWPELVRTVFYTFLLIILISISKSHHKELQQFDLIDKLFITERFILTYKNEN